MERREWLGVATVAAVGALSGCVGNRRSDGGRAVEFTPIDGQRELGTDLVVSHDRERAVRFDVRVLERDTSATWHDAVTVPRAGFRAYAGVFERGGEHTVVVRAAGRRATTDIYNSATNELWATLRDSELSLDVGEE